MSITSDIRTYADNAIEQAQKQVLNVVGTAQSTVQSTVEQAQKQAQQQLNDVTGSANEFVGKIADSAKENVSTISGKASDLRTQAEKALYLDNLRAAVEPYLDQARSYRQTISSSLTERAETVYNTVKSDPRVAKVLDSAESVSTFVLGTVNERLVQPALSLRGRANSRGRKAGSTRPAKKATTAKAPAKKTTAKKTAAKRPAKTSPAKTTAKTGTAAKSSPAKATAAKATAAKKTTARKASAAKATATSAATSAADSASS